MDHSIGLRPPVSETVYVQTLNLICGALLLAAVLILWRRELAAIVRLLVVQGVLLAALAALLPAVLRRVLRDTGEVRETEPLVNVAASLLAGALLTLLAYAVSRPLVALAPSPATQALPVALAVMFLGFFVLVTRRRALSQVVGFLLMDNGITATAFLATSGVPLIVELGVSLDLLLVVLVLQVLTARMRLTFGRTDLDELRELRD